MQDQEVDVGEALEVFLEEPLGIVLSDLLPSHCRALANDEKKIQELWVKRHRICNRKEN